jgi:LysR family glycine cleavage system transcriptional activator
MARLPSLDALHVFAVAARHLNFTSAAAELHRTQSAVSHRVKAL